MNIIILIIFASFLIYTFVVINQFIKGRDALIEAFENFNCCVFGLRGKGKDCIFNKVINAREQPCYATIPYNKDYCVQEQLEHFSVSPNTQEDIVSGNVKIIPKSLKENTDLYISDAGNYLPAQDCASLLKKYPGFPAFYSFSRHLYNMNIHHNTQEIGRVWNILREQTGRWIMAEKTTCLFKTFLITSFIIYDKEESAVLNMRPFKTSLFNKDARALKIDFEAKHGQIKRYKIIQLTKNMHYDSRWAHEMFFGYKSPTSY